MSGDIPFLPCIGRTNSQHPSLAESGDLKFKRVVSQPHCEDVTRRLDTSETIWRYLETKNYWRFKKQLGFYGTDGISYVQTAGLAVSTVSFAFAKAMLLVLFQRSDTY